MKNINLLIWLTQLGLSVVLPLGGFIWLGVWLHRHLEWGIWIVIVCIVIGVVSAADGFRASMKAMERFNKKEKTDPPPVSFNDHY